MAIGPVDASAISLIQPHARFGPASSLGPEAPFGGESPLGPTAGIGGFASLFAEAVGRANAMGHVADAAVQDLAAGRTDDIHGTMIAGQKASIELKLVTSVRNKVVDAFYELWRMSV